MAGRFARFGTLRPALRFGRPRLRTPIIPQLEAAECGAASLGILLAHFGRWVPLEELREACGVSRDGSNAAGIVRAGEQYGLRIRGWRKEVDTLADLQLPAILFWEFNHFLVLEGVSDDRFHLNDPANGRRSVSGETFSEAFTGIVLTADTTERFEAGGEPPNIWRALWPWLRQARGALSYVSLAGLLLAVPALALPILLNIFVDHVLIDDQRDWGSWLVAAMIIAAIAVYLLTWLQQQMLRKIAVQLAITHAQELLWRLFRLPTQYFAHRYAGDLASRLSLVDQIAGSAAQQLVGVVVELIVSALLLALLIVYDPLIGVITLAIAIANVLAARVISRQRTDQNRQLRREQALLFGIETAGLRQIDSLRATAAENDFFVRWSGYQARELTARQRFVELGYVNAALPQLFLVLGGMTVLGLGGWRVIEGGMSIGELIAIYVLAGNFLAPIGRFVQFADSFQLLEADLQRVSDVLTAEEDPALATAELEQGGDGGIAVASLNGRLKLAGRLELRDVSFGYRRAADPLIDNLRLTIEPGQRVAIVGPTGSGKSTLLRLVTGEYTPWSGEILFDGVPASEIPRSILTSSVATVDQQIVLFDGTVRDNLTMWNAAVAESDMVAAARDAMIHEDIMRRTGGYDAHVQEGGRNFSGGQRQRLEIARALVTRPALLCLDEATSTLDAVTEQLIDDALRRRGCSCLIVAHRLSTIRDCDQIIVLDQGREVQRGVHDDLINERDGIYAQLVQSQ